MTRPCSALRLLGPWCLLCALLLSGVSSAAAQVVVLRVDPAAEPLCQAIEAALGNQALAPDPGYFAEAQRQNVDPSSDGALTLLVPLLGVRLAVIPQSATAAAALVEFRDGQTGANLGTASIPLEYNGAVGWQGQRLLQLEVQRRLGGQPGAPAPPAADPSQSQPEAEGGDGIGEGADTEGGASGEDELYLRVFGGAGMAMRNISWPSAGETLKVETGPFMAVELGASFGLKLSPSFELGPELVYQTSLDHQITETHIDGASDTLGVRSHRFEALLAFGFLFGDGFRIAPEVGFALRNLRPAVHHLLTPSYTLSGPLFRLSARIPLGDVVAFQLAPEVQYVLVGDAFQELGMQSTGLAFGGQASFEVALSHEYVIELVYREAHALVPSTMGDDATDIERFATARFRWQP
jgi:hypothetical protein